MVTATRRPEGQFAPQSATQPAPTQRGGAKVKGWLQPVLLQSEGAEQCETEGIIKNCYATDSSAGASEGQEGLT